MIISLKEKFTILQAFSSITPLLRKKLHSDNSANFRMTLMITIETMFCVLLPFHFRQICTKRISLIILFGCILCSIFLHTPFLFSQTVISSPILKEVENRQHNRFVGKSLKKKSSHLNLLFQIMYSKYISLIISM